MTSLGCTVPLPLYKYTATPCEIKTPAYSPDLPSKDYLFSRLIGYFGDHEIQRDDEGDEGSCNMTDTIAGHGLPLPYATPDT
jgi:hypothetical protein